MGFFAITQESPDEIGHSGAIPDDEGIDYAAFGFPDDDAHTEWIPPGPPRWFRSNAGGMALEETPSRLAALHNQYALMIDYIPPDEMEPRLLPYYEDAFSVEIRILYEKGAETRRQWLFFDTSGIVRVNAVFRQKPDVPSVEPSAAQPAPSSSAFKEQNAEETADGTALEGDAANAAANGEADNETGGELLGDIALADTELGETEGEDLSGEAATVADVQANDPPADVSMPDIDSHPPPLIAETALSTGFIELYNAQAQIIEDRWFFDDDSVIMITYFYNGGLLLSAETRKMLADSEFKAMYSDYYLYNRSYSLRRIEREYHEGSIQEPVRLTFPGRVLDAANDNNFMSDKLSVVTDFMGDVFVGEGFRMLYDTDSRGRVMTQTMIDNSNETVWVIRNTWLGDRIVATLKTEGDDTKLTEFEYDAGGDRITQREIHNGVLERVVYTKGDKETEELYMNGVLVLKAYWENGRKISEERVRRR